MYVDPTGYAVVALRELAGATGSTITYDAKTKKATVVLAEGYSVTFDPKAKDKAGKSLVTVQNGRMMIDNETFDNMMSGSRKTKNGTVYASVDSTVVSEVTNKKGKTLEDST